MNFQNQTLSFDKQLGNLLVMIIFFQKKLEEIKKKLAGNQEFHSQLAYQKLDLRKSSQARPQDILYFLSQYQKVRLYGTTIQQVQQFCRKYTTSGVLTYFEFLKIVTPKTNKSLAQRLMIRSPKRGVQMPQYLIACFRQLLENYVKMSHICQTIRKRIQSSGSLNHLQMVQFFKKCLNSNGKILTFINMTAGTSDFKLQDINYLSCHLRSGVKVQEFDDQDIKELVCPLDMNFQKPQVKQFRTQVAFRQNVNSNQENLPTMNFLNKTYQRTQPDMFFSHNRKENEMYMMKQGNKNNNNNNEQKYYVIPPKSNHNTNRQIPQRDSEKQSQQNNYNIHHQQMKQPVYTNRLYIDKFIKPNDGIQLDSFLNRNPNYVINNNQGYQRFEDNLPESGVSSSRSSAFVQYGHY